MTEFHTSQNFCSLLPEKKIYAIGRSCAQYSRGQKSAFLCALDKIQLIVLLLLRINLYNKNMSSNNIHMACAPQQNV